jgi:hypothetical protein
MQPKYGPPVEAGCRKCGQRFLTPTDAAGNVIWQHICPVEEQERLNQAVMERIDSLEAKLSRVLGERNGKP